MKKLFAVVAASTLFLTGCGGTGATNLSATEFQKKISEPGVVVLDVRTVGEFMGGHIAKAINIDVEGMTFDGDIAKLDKSATSVSYTHLTLPTTSRV